MIRTNLTSSLVRCCRIVAAITVAAVVVAVKFSLAQGKPADGRTSPRSNYGTMGFDNTRFFSPRSGPAEDWVRISATGRRSFITEIDSERTALVIVDLQKRICDHWGDALGTVDSEVGEAYSMRLNKVVLPNVAKLLALFRKHDMLVVYTMLGDDVIADPIAPLPERMSRKREFVLHKFSAGSFATSAIDNVLSENGIGTILVTGTDTAGCVLATMTGADDRTYKTIMIEDACAGSRTDLHEAVVRIWNCFGFVRTTHQVIDDYPWRSWIGPTLTEKKEAASSTRH